MNPGKARITAEGDDITLVGISYMQVECLRAQRYLETVGIRAEVIDPIWLAPLDINTIVESARRTKRIMVVDNDWTNCGASAEIIAQVVENVYGIQGCQRLGYAPTTCPPTPPLENLFYPHARTIAAAAYQMIYGKDKTWMPDERTDLQELEFRGPF